MAKIVDFVEPETTDVVVEASAGVFEQMGDLALEYWKPVAITAGVVAAGYASVKWGYPLAKRGCKKVGSWFVSEKKEPPAAPEAPASDDTDKQ